MNKLIINGTIKIEDQLETVKADLLIVDGKIHQIGARSQMNFSLFAPIEEIDAAGAVVLPGFIDAHNHYTLMGKQHILLNLNGLRRKDEILARIHAEHEHLDMQKPLIGFNYEVDYIASSERIFGADLDTVAPGRLVQIMDRSGHMSVTNRRTLLAAGINPDDSEFLNFCLPCKHPVRGFVGEVCGAANSELYHFMQRAFHHPQTLKLAWKRAADIALAHGVTSIHTMLDEEEFDDFLDYRVCLPIDLRIYTETKDVKKVKQAGLKQIGGCGTVMVDGDTGPYTAAFLEPYLDKPDSNGLLYYSDEELVDYVWEAHSSGLQIALHCVGDAASEQFLNAIEEVENRSSRKLRHRIEHYQFGTESQMERAKRLGVAFSIQPAFNYYWAHTIYYESLGRARAENADPIRRLLARGLMVGFGSDCAVTPCDPLLAVHSAVNHSLEKERISAREALRCHTFGGAYLGADEGRRGSISPGKAADLVFLDADPEDVNPGEIKNIPILRTMVKGETVFLRG